jgi:hypothetical protein
LTIVWWQIPASRPCANAFNDGKPADEAVHKTCFACHSPAKDRDFVDKGWKHTRLVSAVNNTFRRDCGRPPRDEQMAYPGCHEQ